MKKTLLALAVLAAATASAQTVTFEDLTLSPQSHNDESDDEGSFVSGGVSFLNIFDTQFEYWAAGFSYSNETDVTTAGYGNSYSSFAGSGANSSSNFAVYYSGMEMSIDLGSEKTIGSVAITNTTYAALSMLHGDDYGKVFGSPNNANGTPDGTNGEDFFKLLIIGLDADSTVTDTVEFYLADFRFADNNLDYILDEWETVDLSSLGDIRFLAFDFESSDVGSFGINTPAYFALDNLSFGSVGIAEEAANAFVMYPNPANTSVKIKGDAGTIRIFNTEGRLISEQETNGLAEIPVEDWNAGMYLVEITAEAGVSRSALVKK